ncbi:sulfurtransferase TusA family protein [Desulfolucanica intricata]|uniref:sulfurtransferase TusA family protein n=1 Tax=Desulfolucanica intricata TaxID=1285191 RepID=UPI0008373D8D|nr:sulfurtransferase TusA family protein [Desulfolucanica intricata]
MLKTVDARGLSCPEPVILTRQLLSQTTEGNVQVIVDNNTAKENVTRTAESMGWKVVVQQDTDIILNLSK